MTNIFEKSWGKWSWMTQESEKFRILAADNACNAGFWHAAGCKQWGLGRSGFSAQGTLVLVSYGTGMLWRITAVRRGDQRGRKDDQRDSFIYAKCFSWWCCTCIHIIISYFLSPYLCGQRHCITFVCCFLLVVRCPELLRKFFFLTLFLLLVVVVSI